MTDLTKDELEKAVLAISSYVGNYGFTVKPTQLLVPPVMFKLARRVLFPHHILKHRKGARGRALTLKWRRK